MKQLYLSILLLVWSILPSFAQNLASYFFISSLESSTEPLYHSESDSIIFTYQTMKARFQPRYVGIAFEHENFVPIHEMNYMERKDVEGTFLFRVYYYSLSITDGIEKLPGIYYRFVIDGSWIEDPSNPSQLLKLSGRKISFADVLDKRPVSLSSPLILDSENEYSKRVQFTYYADPDNTIFLAGSFNNWDPFMYQLIENPENPGRYGITIRLLPGEYQYSFYYQGKRINDPLNFRSSYDIEGYEYSFFSINS